MIALPLAAARRAAPPIASAAPPEELDEAAEILFAALRALRRELADAAGVPAYVVFTDAALRAMAATRPTSEDALLAISGVGPVKIERYGAAFLALLRGRAATAGG